MSVSSLRGAWKRCCWITILSSAVAVGSVHAQQNATPDIKTLMERLNQGRAPDPLPRIILLSNRDPSAREYVIQKLPEMIRGPKSDAWLDAIRLAGALKANETIPALSEAMLLPPSMAKANLTFYRIMQLDGDIVAKALSQIGDPTIPAVTRLLRSKDSSIRGRAILILINIGSPLARKALEHQRSLESSPENVKLIDGSLRP
jgi:HEAT repeat protein